jgi:hypothetical protein
MTPGVYLVRVDPVRLKAALGVLPGVSVLSLITSGDQPELMRTGAREAALDAVLEISAEHDDETSQYETVSIAAGATHVALRAQGKLDLPALAKQKRLRLVPDGDTYLVGSAP